MIRRLLVIGAIAGLCFGNVSTLAAAPQLDTEMLDAIVGNEMKERSLPGLSLAITRHGELVYAKGYGIANIEQGTAVTPQTVFAIGSVSKPVVALAVAKLVEQGAISWDDPISKPLPGTPALWAGVTLAHLASHQSGLPRESPMFDGDKNIPLKDLIEATYKQPLEFPTGTKMQYCNVCYFALAEVITRVSGMNWLEYMERNVFAPAGMKATRATSVKDIVPGRATSYGFKNGVHFNVREFVALRPSGAFLSTALDMVKLEKALSAGTIVRPTTLEQMQTPAKLGDGSVGKIFNNTYEYGYGWQLDTLSGTRRVSHGGSLAGFKSIYSRYPDTGWAVILLSNGADFRSEKVEKEIAVQLLGGTSSNQGNSVK